MKKLKKLFAILLVMFIAIPTLAGCELGSLFKKGYSISFDINSLYSGGGTINLDNPEHKDKFEEGELINLNINTNDGYRLSELKYIGASTNTATNINGTSFIMPNQNVKIYCSFETITTIQLTIENANIPSGEYEVGDTISITSQLDEFVYWYTGEEYNNFNIISYNQTINYTIPENDVELKQRLICGIGLYFAETNAELDDIEGLLMRNVINRHIPISWGDSWSFTIPSAVTSEGEKLVGGNTVNYININTATILDDEMYTNDNNNYIGVYGFYKINGDYSYKYIAGYNESLFRNLANLKYDFYSSSGELYQLTFN